MKKAAILTVAIAVLVGCLVFSGYELITQQVIDQSVQQMKQQAGHDEASLELSLDRCWSELEGAGRFLAQSPHEDTMQLLEHMTGLRTMLDCSELYLVAQDGTVLTGSSGIGKKPFIADMAQKEHSPFIVQEANPDSAVTGVDAYLYAGVPISKLEVEKQTYDRMVMRLPVDYLQEQLDVDSYGGAGYSAIINSNGQYILSSARDYKSISNDNFYDFVETMDMSEDWDAKTIARAIRRGETFYLESTWHDGPYVTAFIPLQATDWYYVLAVPEVYFQHQSSKLLSLLFVLLAAFVLVAVLLILAVLYERIKALQAREKANKAKSSFLNSMSHDIRTPMNAVMGYTALAQNHLDDKAKVQEYLDKIAQSSKHLLSLINDVLGMSRIESGKVELNESPTDLHEMAKGLEDMVISDVKAKNLNLEVLVDVRNPVVLCDRLHLDQVLLNTLSNAVKFTPADGTVTLKIEQKKGNIYEFSVKDTGIGMSPEFVEKIFEPFVREQTSTVSGIQGTGLGMAITKNLVDLMKGDINVQSEPGKGTCISVQLVLQPAKLEKRTEEKPKAFSLQGMQVLLVEDNEFNREIASEILSDAGCLVHTAENGQVAVDKVKQNPDYYDVILMDVQMPVMDGYTASRQVKSINKKIPIVALSANVFEEDQKKAEESGMDAYVSKPLNVTALMEALKKYK